MNRKFPAILLCCLGPLALLLADGPSRPATPAEKAFTLKTMQILEKAVPGLPSGWVLEEKSRIVAPERVSPDAGKYPLPVFYRQDWQHPARLEEFRVKEERLISETAAAMQADQKNMVGLMRELEELSAKFAKALEKKDTAAAERIQKQMEELGKKISGQGESQNRNFDQQRRKIMPRDARVRFRFQVNSSGTDISWYKKEAPVAGIPCYRRETDGPDSSSEGEYLLFLGAFKVRNEGSSSWIELQADPAVSSTAVQSIIVYLAGDKTHTRQLLESMDWVSLKKLLGK